MSGKSGLNAEEIAEKVKNYCTSMKVESDRRILLETTKENLIKLAEELSRIGFDHVKNIAGVDYPTRNQIVVVYHVSSFLVEELMKVIVTIKVPLDRDSPSIPSLTSLWPSVTNLERETYEMFGVKFEGHPDLRRILLPEDFEGVFPLRKDFKVTEEGINA